MSSDNVGASTSRQSSKYPVVSCRLDSALDQRLSLLASQSGRSKGALVRESIERTLPNLEAELALRGRGSPTPP